MPIFSISDNKYKPQPNKEALEEYERRKLINAITARTPAEYEALNEADWKDLGLV